MEPDIIFVEELIKRDIKRREDCTIHVCVCLGNSDKMALIGIQEYVQPRFMGKGEQEYILSLEAALSLFKDNSISPRTKIGDLSLCVDEYCKIDAFGNFSARELSETYSIAKSIAQKIEAVGDLTDLEKVVCVDNWIQQNIQYISGEQSDAGKWKYILENPPKDFEVSVQNVLRKHYGKCESIAATVKIILFCLGVECVDTGAILLSGGSGHAWNLVKIDGEYYILDCTHNITRNDDKADSALKAFSYTHKFTLLGNNAEIDGGMLAVEKYPCIPFIAGISDYEIPRSVISDTISSLKKRGIRFEYEKEVRYPTKKLPK